jgi:hypothetical protein
LHHTKDAPKIGVTIDAFRSILLILEEHITVELVTYNGTLHYDTVHCTDLTISKIWQQKIRTKLACIIVRSVVSVMTIYEGWGPF